MGALYYGNYLPPLPLGRLELIHGLVKVIHKGTPLLVRDVEMHMGIVKRKMTANPYADEKNFEPALVLCR